MQEERGVLEASLLLEQSILADFEGDLQKYNGNTPNSIKLRYYFQAEKVNRLLFQVHKDDSYIQKAEEFKQLCIAHTCPVQHFPKPDPNARDSDRHYD